MKLLTKDLVKMLPPLYSQEDAPDPIVRAHFFTAGAAGDWWITEGSMQGEDFLMFGLCYVHEPELGYVSIGEMQSVRRPLGLGIERDLYWTPVPLSEVRTREAS